LSACSALRKADPAWRDAKWVPEANLHLTLAFLGDVEESRIPLLERRLAEVSHAHTRLMIPFEGLGARPSMRRARLLWARFADPQEACAALAADIAEAAADPGASPETRTFRAHVTLCRARRPMPVSRDALDAALEGASGVPRVLSVPSFTLCASRLTPRGAEYSPIGSWPLGNGE